MREIIPPCAKTRRRFSSSCRRALFVLVLSLGVAGLAATPVYAQATRTGPRVLTTERDLAEVENALAELSRRVETVADALEEEPPAELRRTLESVREELETWAARLPELSVEPADDADIDRRRFRRFERRVARSRETINEKVVRANELLADETDGGS